MDKREFKKIFCEASKAVEKIIEREFYSKKEEYHPSLFEAMEYSLFSGGKRVRPVLLYWISELGEPDKVKVNKSVAAIEYLHTYSLIHDDLPSMDDDSERRGKPTAHIKYSEAMAILSGDALLTESFRLLGESGDSRLGRILGEEAGAGGMVGGQAADIIGLEDIEKINELKTARLFRAAALMGGVAGGFDDNLLDKTALYGINLGKAFQLRDDILDEEAPERDKTLKKALGYVGSALSALEDMGFSGQERKLKEFAEFMVLREK